MYIIVCVKQVKKYNSNKRMNATLGGTTEMLHNPFDLAALSWAIILKKLYGFKVITISMGPPHVVDLVRQLYSYGVDMAVLLTDRKLSGSDTYATSCALGNSIKTFFPDYNVVICGDKSLDSESGQVPHSLAMALGINSYSNIVDIVFKNKCFEMVCETDIIRIDIKEGEKFLITVTQEPKNYVNLPTIDNIISSESKNVKIITYEDIETSDNNVGQEGSFTKVVTLYEKKTVVKRNISRIVFEDKNKESLMKTIFRDRL